MAGAIRLTKAERAWVLRFAETQPEDKIAASIISKLELSELPRKKTGLSPAEAFAAFRESLGSRLITPPNGAAGIYRQISSRLGLLGLTRGDCVTIAKVAAAQWDGRIKAESLVRNADRLLSDAQLPLGEYAPPRRASSPAELGDDDL